MAEFEPAFQRTLLFEDDPRHPGKVTEDAGGRTRFGIAQKFHPDLPDTFFTGPAADALAVAERMEQQEYWDRMRLAAIADQDVANKLFDMAVNMGVHQAGIYAQRAVNAMLPQTGAERLAEDGVLGEKTVAAINTLNPAAYYQMLRDFSASHYRHIAAVSPTQAVNLQGWLKRALA